LNTQDHKVYNEKNFGTMFCSNTHMHRQIFEYMLMELL